MHIDHIGIAVKDLETAIETYEKLLNTPCYKKEVVESQKVETAFLQTGQSKVELLGATDPDSVITKYIEKKGEGLHHVAFEVEDIHAEIERLKSEGFTLLSDAPKPGADKKQIVFLHPKSSNGVLVELCQTVK
ncbi:methylmalonyl-CoA epimerase [Rhodohalobacter sp. 614A]|uniref:methylmalonyl-CoA epimerase n=1 Tax=Rhodohalobacter sp. 614A TaxID=2908649 RepID=UPI001F2A6CAE|nr:methylmalonyl-CoA epimerase [Rhodohalobacter sp. 614A]